MRYFKAYDIEEDDMSYYDAIPVLWSNIPDEFYSELPYYLTRTVLGGNIEEKSIVYFLEIDKEEFDEGDFQCQSNIGDNLICY
jgi:hypothetical protein